MQERFENRAVDATRGVRFSAWFNGFMLLVSAAAVAVVFIPFAVNTSPIDALMLKVPGNQGNWWHALIGIPFLLAFPMIWLRIRALFSKGHLGSATQRFIWVFVAVSACGTISVEVPFLLHRAGTSERQRLLVISLGLGSLLLGAVILLMRGRCLSPTTACLVGLNATFLANASLCLLVYGEISGSVGSRIGWFITMLIVWPIVLELLDIATSEPAFTRAPGA